MILLIFFNIIIYFIINFYDVSWIKIRVFDSEKLLLIWIEDCENFVVVIFVRCFKVVIVCKDLWLRWCYLFEVGNFFDIWNSVFVVFVEVCFGIK